jgi:hypothetical protein
VCAGNEALLGSALFSSCCAAAFQIRRCCCFGGGVCGADADSELHSGRTSEQGPSEGPCGRPEIAGGLAGQCTSSRGRTTKTCAAIFERRREGVRTRAGRPPAAALGFYTSSLVLALTRRRAIIFTLSQCASGKKRQSAEADLHLETAGCVERDAHFIKYGDRPSVDQTRHRPTACLRTFFF